MCVIQEKLAFSRTSEVREVVNAVVAGDEAKSLFREEFNGPFVRHLKLMKREKNSEYNKNRSSLEPRQLRF